MPPLLKTRATPLMLVFAAAVLTWPASSLAAGGKHSVHADDRRSSRNAVPLKDCTRLNGRWGYYGNPWCTPAEQRAFDVWEARRIERNRHAR